jgi:hypothetical protein
MLELNAKTTALVVIDLQEGDPLLLRWRTSYGTRCGLPAPRSWRKNSVPTVPRMVMVRVGWSDDYAEALKQPVDAQTPAKALPENWWDYPAALGKCTSDLEITNASGAHSTAPIWNYSCVAGVSIPSSCAASLRTLAIESTARNAWELVSVLSLQRMPVVPPVLSNTWAA